MMYVRLATLYGSEAWCLREIEIVILRRTERSMVRAMCGVIIIIIMVIFTCYFSRELIALSHRKWCEH